MRNIAVLLQLIGLIITFTIDVIGYILGPLLIIIGGILYRKETQKIKEQKKNKLTI